MVLKGSTHLTRNVRLGASARRRLAGALSAVLLMSQLAVAKAPERTMLATTPRPVSDFALTNQQGKTFRLSQLSGAPVLVFFGFSHCPSVCPAALTQLRMLETNHARELGATRIVIVSVDGERDTPARMAEWLTPISPKFIGLTGPTAQVHDIASQFSAAFFKGSAQPSGEYLVEHNAQVFLLDGQGRLRATFFDAPVATMAEVTQSIASGSDPGPAPGSGSQPPGD